MLQNIFTGLGSYTHCLNPDDAVFLKYLPEVLQVIVTFSLNGTKTLSGSARIICKPSLRSSDNVTHRASVKIDQLVMKVMEGQE